eukprot:3178592-Alexandrium_andersonii.AAC.1
MLSILIALGLRLLGSLARSVKGGDGVNAVQGCGRAVRNPSVAAPVMGQSRRVLAGTLWPKPASCP